DIVTHMYAPAPNGILDEKGRLFPDVAAARRRGIIFDFGNGVLDHFDWATVERATKQSFWPDTISTDWNVMSKTTGVVDFPNVMSKFIMFGMPLSQIIACATVNAARVFPSFAARSTWVRRLTWQSWSCGTAASNSSTTTRGRARAASGYSRPGPCWRASRCRALSREREVARSKAQCDQFNSADTDHEHCERYGIVVKPIPLGLHDTPPCSRFISRS